MEGISSNLEAKKTPSKQEVVKQTQNQLKNLDKALVDSNAPIDEAQEASESYRGAKFDDKARYEQAQNEIKNLPQVEDIIGTVEELSQLTADQLIKLEDNYPGILLYAFTDIVGQDTKLDFNNWGAYKQPTPGMRLVINFRGNRDAERKIGSGDIMPVSVRVVTVYEDGDANRKRTSDVRIGLKGRNQAGTGFFDKQGYIPVFSGDVVLIGGEDKPEVGVDPTFDQKFPTEEAYKASSEYKTAWAQLTSALKPSARESSSASPKKRPRFKRVLTPKEALVYMESLRDGSVGARLIKSVQAIIAGMVYPKHCWDWINTVYKMAGITKKVRIYQNLNYEGKDCGDCHAPDEMVAALQPGDWVYYNNCNKYDTHGNHSAIFCGWKDESHRIALMASGANGRIGRFHVVDLVDQPVTHITRPVA